MKTLYLTLFLCGCLAACKGEDMPAQEPTALIDDTQIQAPKNFIGASLNYKNIDTHNPDKKYNLLDLASLTEAPEIASWAGATAFVSDYETQLVKKNNLDAFWVDAQTLGLNRAQFRALYHTTIQVAAATEYEFTRLWWSLLNSDNNPSLTAVKTTIEKALLSPQGKNLQKNTP